MRGGLVLVVSMGALAGWACGSAATSDDPMTGDPGKDAGASEAAVTPPADAEVSDAPGDAAVPAVDTLPANRDRLLATYLAYLKATPGKQSNGLDGSKLTGICDLWRTLVPSAQSVYLTLTARLQGSKLDVDARSMLSHATKLYRVAGGDGSTSTGPGQCGGDGNRIFLSIDQPLHGALLLANTSKGMIDGGGPVIADVPAGGMSIWRDSHDFGGAHAPFDLSDETDNAAPRGQVQFFASTASAKATQPLGRTDLTALVDPYALEVDQDYDCPHNSNPLCDYVTYGPLCAPGPSKTGVELFTAKYGSIDPSWQPIDCAGK
jgi:hypothetical protein